MQIRHAVYDDAQSLLDLFVRLDGESEFMLFEPGERDTSLAEQRSTMNRFAEDSSRVMLVAEDAGICGFCVLSGGQQKRVAHSASLVLGVLRSHWGQGIGSQLLTHAISAAKKAGFSRLELSVNENNLAAIKLYEKFGFVKEGVRNKALRINNRMVNEFYMARVDQGRVATSIV